MKILKKINVIRDEIKINPEGNLSKEIEEQSIAALFGGIKSDEWKTYMQNFCSNAAQLNRLRGLDEGFLKDEDGYGPKILAYIGGSGPCGGGTRLGMAADMVPAMRRHLDAGIDSATGPGDCNPMPESLTKLLKEERLSDR